MGLPYRKVPAKDLYRGAVEHHGPYVTISHENGCFHIKRHPQHPYGWAREGCATLPEARRIATRLRAEAPRRSKNEPACD